MCVWCGRCDAHLILEAIQGDVAQHVDKHSMALPGARGPGDLMQGKASLHVKDDVLDVVTSDMARYPAGKLIVRHGVGGEVPGRVAGPTGTVDAVTLRSRDSQHHMQLQDLSDACCCPPCESASHASRQC